MKNKRYRFFLYIGITLFLLVGCSLNRTDGEHDPDKMHIMFISSVPPSYQEVMVEYFEQYLTQEVNQGLEIEVSMNFASYDRLTVEIINREVDVFVVDEFLENILIDPYLLTPLDKFTERLPDDVDRTRFQREDESNGEKHLYAIPLLDHHLFIQDLGLDLEEDLLVGVVNTSPHRDAAFQLIEQLFLKEGMK